jgi:pimeloyl-ACP methyl ester carboxylesterase
MKRILLLAFLLAIMSITGSAQEIGGFIPARCLISIPGIADVECAYVTVPVRYGDPSAGSMQLAVAVIRATAPQAQPDPVLYLAGGPGGGALYTIDLWVDQPFARDRDVILFDQRGTGFSEPLLICENYGIDLNLQIIDYQMACAEALTADGIDLSAYSSAQSAQDIALVVEALGYDQVNLYGISYGTRLALTLMRDQPQIVRAAVLDSPYPLHINALEQQTVNGFNAMDQLLSACAGDEACAHAYPDLRDQFYEWVDSRDRVELDLGMGPKLVSGSIIVRELFGVLYGTAALPYVPKALSNIVDGDAGLFSALASGYYGTTFTELRRYAELETWAEQLASRFPSANNGTGTAAGFDSISLLERIEAFDRVLADIDADDYIAIARLHLNLETMEAAEEALAALSDEEAARLTGNIANSLAFGFPGEWFSDGVYNSVICTEELPFNSRREGDQISMQVPPTIRFNLMQDVYYNYNACRGWGVEPASAFENDPVQSEIPVLVLAGQFDPITPPLYAEAAAKSLTNAQVVTVPGAGHGVIDAGDCPTSLTAAFLEDPSAPVDTACIALMRVDWVTR